MPYQSRRSKTGRAKTVDTAALLRIRRGAANGTVVSSAADAGAASISKRLYLRIKPSASGANGAQDIRTCVKIKRTCVLWRSSAITTARNAKALRAGGVPCKHEGRGEERGKERKTK